jgi:hypothetical protein
VDAVAGPTGTLSQLQSQIEGNVLNGPYGLYSGIRLNSQGFQPPAPAPPNGYFGIPFAQSHVAVACDPVAGKINNALPEGVPGNTVNHLNQTCGDPTLLTVSTYIQPCSCDPTGFLSSNGCYHCTLTGGCGKNMHCEQDFQSTTQTMLTVDASTGTNGTLESALFRGAWVAAVDCYYQQVRAEVATNNALLSVSPACLAAGNWASSLGSTADSVAKTIDAQITAASNLDENNTDIWNCAATGQTSASDPGQLRQAAQQLCAARASLESLFNQLVVCETLARAETSYEASIFYTPNAIATQLAGSIDSPTGDFRSSIQGTINSALSACTNACEHKDDITFGPWDLGTVVDGVNGDSSGSAPAPFGGSQGACSQCAEGITNPIIRSNYNTYIRNFYANLMKSWDFAGTHGACQ